MAHVNPMAVVAALVEHVSTELGERLYDAADRVAFERAPESFTGYQMRPVEVQDGLAVMDAATYLLTVDFFDIRPRVPGTETDQDVGAKLAQIADLATAYTAWRGDYAVVQCVALSYSVAGGDEVSDALEGQAAVTAGSVAIRAVVIS